MTKSITSDYIIIMRIPYEKRLDRYDIAWKTVGGETEHNLKSFQYATITIHELWSIGHLIFTKPLKIEVFLDGPEEDTGRALAVYDFGMEQDIPTKKENNFLYNYGGPNEAAEPIKTVFSSIKFDLMHAFFHYTGDPNYGAIHWALTGHLTDRVTADDSFIFDDFEWEEAKAAVKITLPTARIINEAGPFDDDPQSPQMSMGHGQS